jgi:hypothetical protein
VETYNTSKEPQGKWCQFRHTQRNCGYAPRCNAYGEVQPTGTCQHKAGDFVAAGVEERRLQAVAFAVSGWKQRELLESERKGRAAKMMVCHASACKI